MKKNKKAIALTEMDFYSIESDNEGQKNIHIFGTLWHDDGRYVLTEYTGFIEPLADFIAHIREDKDYVSNAAPNIKQYEEDLTAKQAKDCIKHYFNGESAEDNLDYNEITLETPIGTYVAI